MIERLVISQLRNLISVDLAGLKHCNVFVGQNGSGKTSLLESIFLLSRGKSFRHHQPRHYINHDADLVTVFAQFDTDSSMAVAKSKSGEAKLRFNTTPVGSQSELTRHLPVTLLDPSQLDLLDAGSSERRQLLDWLAFHHHPYFYRHWLSYQRVLKQRNRLLKLLDPAVAGMSESVRFELSGWTYQLSSLGEELHHIRTHVVKLWEPLFKQILGQFLPQYEQVSMRYHPGFDAETGLLNVLNERMDKDIEGGYTRQGAHRGDLTVYVGKRQAADVFSRGEKKLLIMALKLSQIKLLTAANKLSVVLLDDVMAELDTKAVERLLIGLSGCQAQLFITSLDAAIMDKVTLIWGDRSVAFGIEQGKISPLI